jgi:TPR repeat protein
MYKETADNSHDRRANLMVGIMYCREEGVGFDAAEGKRYLTVAAEMGDPAAKEILQKLNH